MIQNCGIRARRAAGERPAFRNRASLLRTPAGAPALTRPPVTDAKRERRLRCRASDSQRTGRGRCGFAARNLRAGRRVGIRRVRGPGAPHFPPVTLGGGPAAGAFRRTGRKRREARTAGTRTSALPGIGAWLRAQQARGCWSAVARSLSYAIGAARALPRPAASGCRMSER